MEKGEQEGGWGREGGRWWNTGRRKWQGDMGGGEKDEDKRMKNRRPAPFIHPHLTQVH